MDYKLFCFGVFCIQIVIAIVDFVLARKHWDICNDLAAVVDTLAGISWTMTAGWWLYCMIFS